MKTKFEIIINTDKILNQNDILEVMHNIQARLQGYHTECPKCLINSDMSLIHKDERKQKIKRILK